MILKMCSRYYDASGIVKNLDSDSMMKFEHIIQGMAASSLHCIAFTHVEVAEEEVGDEEGNTMVKVKENGLTLLGLVGIKDSCRPEAIATECGILQPNQDTIGAVIEGEEFRNYTPEERLEKVDKICVMARSSPFDKLLMVQCLKQKGHVVAVTGDGTNDAPTLKEVDIGLSMGIQGTEVAKESSDIVILGDNFASVVSVVKWGRCSYNNIQKFIQFQLTVNIAALAINFVAAVLVGKLPHSAVQLLWVNLIMDTLGALALATEKATIDLMYKPALRGESLLGVTQGVNDTLVFHTFVLCQVFNLFNAREMENRNVFKYIKRNKLFMGIIGITIIIQVVVVEFLRRFADTDRLNWEQWGICIGLASITWSLGWVVKFIPISDTIV
ncbi:hypothetical protein VNO78_33696 [Psophocarpus tetragonolobus]|uniref:Cation-transporting P-type ATPase C-terminal domain-containing protein n=1 Tax=Psophocarpus tetragonolobus TaxID=3891 RepID=A0AAN9RSA9_PSOTE